MGCENSWVGGLGWLRGVLPLLLIGTFLGCGEDPVVEEAPPAQIAATDGPTNTLPRFPQRPDPFRLRDTGNALLASRREPPPVPAEQEVAVPRPEPQRGVREAQLAAAFGSAADCLVPGSLPGGSATLSLRAVVSGSGRVTRAEVSLPASREVVRCLRQKAERLTLPGPVEGAPLSLSVSVPVTAPPAPVSDAPLVRPLPAGAEAPGVVLPATGRDGLGVGYVPPDTTLPARVDSDMPAGYVPPGETLPAQGAPAPRRSITRY